jgi:hypothetical protein
VATVIEMLSVHRPVRPPLEPARPSYVRARGTRGFRLRGAARCRARFRLPELQRTTLNSSRRLRRSLILPDLANGFAGGCDSQAVCNQIETIVIASYGREAETVAGDWHGA